jgi:hypothetical protein
MPDAAVARTAHELQMLEAMVDCAHGFGMAFAEASRAETDFKRKLQLFDAFQRGFLAMRMGIRLSAMLREAPKPVRFPALGRAAPEREEPEAAEAEREERERDEPIERERERDYEPVSLPKFLATLGLVARDAARLDGLPADIRERTLPALQGLLAQANPPPPRSTASVDVLVRPPPPDPRRRLLGSASTLLSKAPPGSRPRPPPRSSG